MQETQLRAQKLGKQDTASAANQETSKATQSDQVQISGKTREIESLREVISQMPEIRTDKVEALRNSIQDGTYKVNSEGIAGRILEEI